MIERKYGKKYPQPPHCSFSGNGKKRRKKNWFSYIYYRIGLWFGSLNNVLQRFNDYGSNSESSMNGWRVFQHHSHKAYPYPVHYLRSIERE